MPAQQHCDSFRFRRAALYNGLRSKVGLAAAKTTGVRIKTSTLTDVALSPLLLSILPRAPLSSSPASLLTTPPSPAPLTSVRWPDSIVQAVASSAL